MNGSNLDGLFAVYYSENGVSSPRELYKTVREATKVAMSPEGKSKGARFKRFPTSEAAMNFLDVFDASNKSAQTSNTKALPPADPVVPFPSVSRAEMNRLKKLIEADNIEEFSACVRSNPRYLVNVASDTAAIVSMALYCTSASDVTLREANLLESYLEMPEKGFGDTPLHIACKWGHPEVVKLLLTFAACNRDALNKEGKLAAELLCIRSGDAATRSRLSMLLHSHFVSLYRSEDNCLPGRLMLSSAYPDNPSSGSLFSSQQLPSSPALHTKYTLAAYAGPFDGQGAAEEFLRQWRCKDRDMPRRDAEKGMERVGRELARDFAVEWSEIWPFSPTPIQLNTQLGWDLLEEHLKKLKRREAELEEAEEFVDALEEVATSSSPIETHTQGFEDTEKLKGEALNDSLRGLSSLMENLTVHDDSSGVLNDANGDEEEEKESDEEVFSTPASSPPPIFLCYEYPTSADTQIFEVLSNATEESFENYPHIRHFLRSMRRLTPVELSNCPALGSPLHTPRRRRILNLDSPLSIRRKLVL